MLASKNLVTPSRIESYLQFDGVDESEEIRGSLAERVDPHPVHQPGTRSKASYISFRVFIMTFKCKIKIEI